MPSRKIHLKIMFIESQTPESDSDDSESLSDLMTTFKEQMKEIEEASKTIRTQVKDLYTRAKEETTDWLNEPLIPKPALKKWLQTQGLSTTISIDEFLDICYNSAKTMDLESRILTFHKADAAVLWNGQRRLTVFDIVTLIPTLFE
jgi:hypothetical protein